MPVGADGRRGGGNFGVDRHDQEDEAEAGQQSAQHAAQGDYRAAGADGTDAGVGGVDAADQAGRLGAGAGGAGLGQVLLGPLQERVAILHFGHLVGVAGRTAARRCNRSLVVAS